eukprot:TRINITY_DN7905_c0_g2_i2.p1 TRINITY_DN7905_c0_g2~~TRINITY_DN7905_c0_g2_i2.p1  ORF type:complete len:213 (-),score=16.21 TRINITY_DN7905_c0_g2_i2:296-934(-)
MRIHLSILKRFIRAEILLYRKISVPNVNRSSVKMSSAVPPSQSAVTKKQECQKVYQYYANKFPKVPQISIQDVLQKRREKSEIVMIDSRTEEEQQVSIIPGAITIQEFDFQKESYKTATVACYCTVGYRSGACAQKLREQGFDAYNLEGSILGWVQDGQQVVDKEGGQEVKKIHVFANFWAYQPDDYEGVTFKYPILVGIQLMLGMLNPFKR